MTQPEVDPIFRDGLRRQLTLQATRTPRRRAPRLFIIGGLSLGILAIGGAAVAGGMLALPGAEEITVMGTPMIVEGSGTGVLNLVPAPAGATKVRIVLTCLTAGAFTFPRDAGTFSCTDDDLRSPGLHDSGVDLPLEQLGDRLEVTAGTGERWRLTATYLDAQQLPLAVNDNGDTYGVMDGPPGQPDLVAVVATNGRTGYVYADQLAEADGTTAADGFHTPDEALAWQAARARQRVTLPVYLSDGTTVIGEFVVGG